MGKHTQKRRKKSTGSIGASTDQSSVQDVSPALSQILGEANNVLYESTPVSQSTPIHKSAVTQEQASVSNSDVNRKLDYIVKKLGKLDQIVEAVSRMDVRISQMERRIKTVEGRTVEFEKSVEFVSKKLDEFDQQCRKLSEQQKQGQERDVHAIRKNLDSVIKDSGEIANLKEAVLDLKCRSMKNNLVFTGLGGETNKEDTERKLRNFIFHELGLEHHIEFGNVHRFGRFQSGKDRPIVARFIYQGDLVCVKKSAYKLKGKPYGIHEQYPS